MSHGDMHRPDLRPRTKEIIDPDHPLLEANRAAIESIERRTFDYGSTEAHKLDVYYPPLSISSQASCKPPILLFFYGGGLSRGMRSSPPLNLVHNNLGAFFASRGILTVIPDYRFVPSIIFPQGSQDVGDALGWVIEHLTGGESDCLFILGHSAGGIHISGLMFTPSMFAPVAHAVRGVILMGVPYEIQNSKRLDFRAAAEKYYGSAKKLATNQPLGLLRLAEMTYVAALPPVRSILARSEPRVVSSSTRSFATLFREKGGKIEEHVLEGHDHLSPILALSSGSGEEWGDEVLEWILTIHSTTCM